MSPLTALSDVRVTGSLNEWCPHPSFMCERREFKGPSHIMYFWNKTGLPLFDNFHVEVSIDAPADRCETAGLIAVSSLLCPLSDIYTAGAFFHG